jgi:hypothetical protein
MSNGLKLGGLGIRSMDDCGLGDNKMFQAWWMKWLTLTCNLDKVSHNDMGSICTFIFSIGVYF